MPPFWKYVSSTCVSKRSTQVNFFPSFVVTATSMPGLMFSTSGMWMVYLSKPVRPRDSASSPALKQRGIKPMPTRLLRWMRSKLFAITAFTPCRYGPLAAQSRELPLPYSAPARIIVSTPSSLYLCYRKPC
jgi:hypothetical protein